MSITLLWVAAPRALDAANRVRNYPKLLARIATQDNRLAQIQPQLKELQATVSTADLRGIAEGRAQVIGASFSQQLTYSGKHLLKRREHSVDLALFANTLKPATSVSRIVLVVVVVVSIWLILSFLLV